MLPLSTEQPEFPTMIQTCEQSIWYQLTFAIRHPLHTTICRSGV